MVCIPMSTVSHFFFNLVTDGVVAQTVLSFGPAGDAALEIKLRDMGPAPMIIL